MLVVKVVFVVMFCQVLGECYTNNLFKALTGEEWCGNENRNDLQIKKDIILTYCNSKNLTNAVLTKHIRQEKTDYNTNKQKTQ